MRIKSKLLGRENKDGNNIMMMTTTTTSMLQSYVSVTLHREFFSSSFTAIAKGGVYSIYNHRQSKMKI